MIKLKTKNGKLIERLGRKTMDLRDFPMIARLLQRLCAFFLCEKLGLRVLGGVMKKSIKVKLVVIMLLIACVPLLVSNIITNTTTSKIVTESFEHSNLEIVKSVEYGIENQFETYKSALEIFANMDSAKDLLRKPYEQYALKKDFASYLEKHDDVVSLYIGTLEGKMIDPTWDDIPSDYDPRVRPWYIPVAENLEPSITIPYFDEEANGIVVSLSHPIVDDKDRFVGVISMDIDVNKLALTINEIKVGKKGYPVLIDQNNMTITHKNPELINKELPVQEIKDALAVNDEGVVEYKYEGVDKFAVYTKNEGTGWFVLVIMDNNEVDTILSPIKIQSVIILVLALLLTTVIAITLAVSLVKPIISLEKSMKVVQDGDLSSRTEVLSKDEVGTIAISFNMMLDHFSSMLSKSKEVANKVSQSAENLASGSEEVNASSIEIERAVDEIAVGAGEQANEAEVSATVMSSLSKKLQVLNKDSEIMADAALQVSKANANGVKAIEELRSQSHENDVTTARIEKAVTELEKKSSEVGSILETIASIAGQTNLLALNASIEAARAGEHGRGFAVVAEEIRKLAEGSSQAADDIKKIIDDIQNESRNTVVAMGDVIESSKEQKQAVSSVNGVFVEINESTEKIAVIIDEVVNFINDVNTDKEEMITAIEKISAVSEETAAASEEVTASVQQQTYAIEEVAKSAEQLNEMAEDLQKEINQFKI